MTAISRADSMFSVSFERGHMHGDDIRLGEQRLEVGEAHVELAGPALGNVRVVDEHLHVEGAQAGGHP
jgi:hypothetical protein